jgi:hypothetical protein
MRFPHHTRMSVTRRGDKELRLGAFIARGLDGIAQSHELSQPERQAILVIARSGQSPVVRSLAALVHEIAAAGARVRIVLLKPDAHGLPEALIGACARGLDCEVRRAGNPRLIEAHEQLVVGARICWTGDSMRRDPAICDAYESFVEDCPEIAAAAAAMFERLWTDGMPMANDVPAAADRLAPPKAIGVPGLMPRRT